MNESWKQGFKRAILFSFSQEAEVRASSKERNYFSHMFGIDYERTSMVRKHIPKCDVDVTQSPMPVDSQWEEFMGTFYERDTTRYGLDGTITCMCREVQDVEMRWNGSFSELLWSVLRNDDDN